MNMDEIDFESIEPDQLPPELLAMMMEGGAPETVTLRQKARLVFQMSRVVWQASPLLCLLSLILTLIQALVPVGTAWIMKLIFDEVQRSLTTDATVEMSTIFTLIFFQAILLLVSKILPSVQQYYSKELGRSLKIEIQRNVYEQINRFAGIRYYESPEFHDLFRLSQQGAQMGPEMMINTMTGMVRGVTTLISFIVVVAALSYWMVGLLLLTIIPQLLIMTKIGGQRFSLAFELSSDERKSFYYGHILGATENAKEIRLFGLGGYLLDKLIDSYTHIHAAEREQDRRELRLTSGLELLATGVTAVTFGVIVIRAVRRFITLGDVTLYHSAIGAVQGSLHEIVFGMAQLNENALFFSHYDRLMKLPQPIEVTPDPLPMPPLAGVIELKDVWFRYADNLPWILKGVNLTLPIGSCLALVGLNGAGKSTLVKLLTRMYDPTKGEILWDGVDINRFDPADYRAKLGTVFQDFVNYDLSARENIGLGNIELIEDLPAIRNAAYQAGAAPFIESLPEQYDTILSRWLLDGGDEAGTDLSGGQWQRIAIARTFMRQADLLMLDEPTAALDAEAEYDMYARFTSLIEGKTAILISHRFSTVRMADRIAVLAGGEIVEEGAHADLMKRPNGIYRELYRKQAERYEMVDANVTDSTEVIAAD